MESLIPCAQASPQKELKINHEETKVRESSDDKKSTVSNTLKEFKNSEEEREFLSHLKKTVLFVKA